jgi:hypothetical protein
VPTAAQHLHEEHGNCTQQEEVQSATEAVSSYHASRPPGQQNYKKCPAQGRPFLISFFD